MSAVVTFEFKPGATFEATLVRTRDDGTPWDLTNTTLASQVRRRDGTLLSALTPTKANQAEKPGEWTLRAASSATATWPLGELVEWDWSYTEADGTVEQSSTILIRLRRRVTR